MLALLRDLATFRRKKPFSDDRATNLGARTDRQVFSMDTDHLFTEMCDNGSTDAARIEDLGPSLAPVGNGSLGATSSRHFGGTCAISGGTK